MEEKKPESLKREPQKTTPLKKIYLFKNISSIEDGLKIENEITKLKDVFHVHFNMKSGILHLQTEREDIHEKIHEIIYRIDENIAVSYMEKEEREEPVILSKVLILIGLLLIALALGLVTEKQSSSMVTYPAYIVAYFILGMEVLKKAFNRLRMHRFLDQDILILIATFLALIGQHPIEALVVLVAYQVVGLIFPLIIERCQGVINDSYKADVNVALRQEDGCHRVSYKSVSVGDVLEVVNGEELVFKGIIIEGEALVDTYFLDGKKDYTWLKAGDEILDGSIIVEGHLAYQVSEVWATNIRSQVLRDYKMLMLDSPKQFYRLGRWIHGLPYLFVIGGLLVIYSTLQEFGASFAQASYRGSFFFLMASVTPFEISLQHSVLASLSVLYHQHIAIKHEGGYFSKLLRAKYVVLDLEELEDLTKAHRRFLNRFKYMGKIRIVFTQKTGDDFMKMKKYYHLHHLYFATSDEMKKDYLRGIDGQKMYIGESKHIEVASSCLGGITLGGYYLEHVRQYADFILGHRKISAITQLYRVSLMSTLLINVTCLITLITRGMMISKGYAYTTNLMNGYGVEVCLSLLALMVPVLILKNKKDGC